MSEASIKELQDQFNMQKRNLLNLERNYINAMNGIDPASSNAQVLFDKYSVQFNNEVDRHGKSVGDFHAQLTTAINATDPNDKAAYEAAQRAKADMAIGVQEMRSKIDEVRATSAKLTGAIKNPYRKEPPPPPTQAQPLTKIESPKLVTPTKKTIEAVNIDGKLPIPELPIVAIESSASTAASAAKKALPKVESQTTVSGGMSVVNVPGKLIVPGEGKDFRVRISPQTDAIDQIYGPPGPANILTPLRRTMGLMFPYTPSISWNQSVEYTQTSLTHSNQDSYTYKNTPSTMVSIEGEFTVQNQKEGEYLLAVMHYLRVVSKMYFGEASFKAPSTGQPSLAGMPPPVLILHGYGDFMFNDLPVIVKDHSYSMKDNISYVDIKTAGGSVRLPSMMSISIKLVVQNTPKRNRKEFDLNQFRTGELMKKGGWI
jgi:hypothetical protein